MTELKELIKKLEDRKAELLFTICENNKIYIPEVIFQMVIEIREITNILKLLKNKS